MSKIRNAILTALIEGALTELMVKTKVDNVYVDDTTTLAAKLAEMIASLNNKALSSDLTSGLAAKANAIHSHAQSEVSGLETALSNRPTNDAMNNAIAAAIDDLIDGAPGTYDTLKEIAEYITEHEDVVESLTAAIGNKADKSVVTAIQNVVNALGSLASKSLVSESDLDANLKEKVNAASEGNHSHNNKALLDTYDQSNADIKDAVSKKHTHSNKSVLDGIASSDVNNWNSKGRVYVQASQPPGMTASDLLIKLI